MFQQLNTKFWSQSTCRCLSIVLFLFLLVSCGKNKTFQEANESFLTNKPGDRGYEKDLKIIADELYQKKWGKKFKFIKPKFRHEKMQVEWEDKKTKKSKRKFSSLRCHSYIDRFALSYFTSLIGPVNITKLITNPDYKKFCENLNELLTVEKIKPGLEKTLMELRNNVLNRFNVSLELAEQNEKKYRVGILITAGFYMGLPLYKRITLDNKIRSRRELLRIYLHECGHQLFHKSRRFSKSLKLGLSWIGWRKSANSWWTVEEKSCNLFAELILADWEKELKKQSQYKKYIKPLGTSQWHRTKFVKSFKERYASLFFDKAIAMRKLYNKRIHSRYSTKDKVAAVLRNHLKSNGIRKYLVDINKCISLQEVLLKLKTIDNQPLK